MYCMVRAAWAEVRRVPGVEPIVGSLFIANGGVIEGYRDIRNYGAGGIENNTLTLGDTGLGSSELGGTEENDCGPS